MGNPAFWSSVRCAVRGIADVLRTQRNARIHVVLGVCAVGLGAACGLTATEWLALILTIGGVVALECINTAIEAAVDLASPGWNDLARRAKDASAAAVLLAAATSLVVGLLLFGPRAERWLSQQLAPAKSDLKTMGAPLQSQ